MDVEANLDRAINLTSLSVELENMKGEGMSEEESKIAFTQADNLLKLLTYWNNRNFKKL